MIKQIVFVSIFSLCILELSGQNKRTNVPSCDTIYTVVDSMPQYSGGFSVMFQDIDKLIDSYFTKEERFKMSKGNGVPGRIVCSVVINKEGKVCNPTIFRAVDPFLDKTALQIVSQLQRFTPGKRNGKAVCVEMKIPIRFHIQ